MLRLIAIICLALFHHLVYAIQESRPLTISTKQIVNQAPLAAYAQYIESKVYPNIQLDDSLVRLNSHNLVVKYTPEELYKFYTDKICERIFLINCNQNIKNLKSHLSIDLNTQKGLINPDLERVDGYKVNYQMPGMDNLSRNLSGGILIPRLKTEQIKGVVIFYHFTVLNKFNVPSQFFADELKISQTLASVIAAQGYIVLMPDYIGLGDDHQAIHPYILYPEINAQSGIYMLKLLNQLVNDKTLKTVNNKAKLYLSGYSEGAAYALWAAKILEQNPPYLKAYNMQLTKTIPMSGAYNVSKLILPFLYDNVVDNKTAPYLIEDYRVLAFARPALIANVLNSYQHYSINDKSQVFNSNFANCYGCTVNNNGYNLSELLQANITEMGKYSLIYQAALKTSYSNTNNSAANLVYDGLLTQELFKQSLIHADIYNWQAKLPVIFITLDYDSIVPKLNSQVAFAAMSAQKSVDIKLVTIPNRDFKVRGYIPFTDTNTDHIQGFSFSVLFMRNELN